MGSSEQFEQYNKFAKAMGNERMEKQPSAETAEQAYWDMQDEELPSIGYQEAAHLVQLTKLRKEAAALSKERKHLVSELAVYGAIGIIGEGVRRLGNSLAEDESSWLKRVGSLSITLTGAGIIATAGIMAGPVARDLFENGLDTIGNKSSEDVEESAIKRKEIGN